VINERFVELLESKMIKNSILWALVGKYNPIVHVDRTVYPAHAYPHKTEKILYPEFELKGPGKFNVKELRRRFCPEQEKGFSVGGHDMYKYLRIIDLLRYCINLADILAIQARGVKFFRSNFSGEALFAWASVVQSHGGSLYVPYLVERDGKVVIVWQLLIIGILPRIPILCHAKK